MKREIQEVEPIHHLSWRTGLLFVAYLILTLSFYYLLAEKVPRFDFGTTQVLASLVAALVFTTIYSWISKFMMINNYLGLIIGILLGAGMVYALFLQFTGPNTTIFALLGGLITLIYLIVSFFYARKYGDN